MSSSGENSNFLPEATSPRSGLIPTLNKMGYMTESLDDYGLKFIEFCKFACGPILDIGAAYGVATLQALSKGCKVVANDLDEQHLKILEQLCPDSLRKNLSLLPGKFPDELQIEDASFAAIFMCRVIHFFSPDEVVKAIKKLFDILLPGGRLYLIADTPYLRNWANYIPIYEQRKRKGEKFPGFVANSDEYITDFGHNLPKMFNFMDPDILHRELSNVGFLIENVDFINRFNYPDTVRWDGREGVGAIAIKPSS